MGGHQRLVMTKRATQLGVLGDLFVMDATLL